MEALFVQWQIFPTEQAEIGRYGRGMMCMLMMVPAVISCIV